MQAALMLAAAALMLSLYWDVVCGSAAAVLPSDRRGNDEPIDGAASAAQALALTRRQLQAELGTCSHFDINGDDVINVPDLLALLSNYGCCCGDCCPGCDQNADGLVNVVDVLALLAWFNVRCPETANESAAAGIVTARPGDVLDPGTVYSIPRSATGELLAVVKSSNSSRWSIPCARSYDGYDWEVVQPRNAMPEDLVHVLSCSVDPAGSCNVSIPLDSMHALGYSLTSFSASPTENRHAEADRQAAKLLMQASFGPTRTDMALLTGPDPAFASQQEWILDQMYNQPPTLHRAYYRRRANPRIETTTEVGRPRGACGTNSRWNRIAIRADDMTQNISFSVVSTVGGTNVTAMFIDGVLRSEVNLNDMRPFGLGAPVSRPQPGDNCGWCQRGGLTMDTTYVICRVQEWPMGLVAIGTECTEGIFPGATNRVELYNVLMEFTALPYPSIDALGQPIEVLTLHSGDAVVLPLAPTIYNPGVLMVSELQIECPFSLGAQLRATTTVRYDGDYYRYDPRLALEDNTLERPYNQSSTVISGEMRTCPRLEPGAPKTWLNEQGCVISHGCYQDDYTNDRFELNTTTLRQFFLEGNNYVYAIDNLPLGADNAAIQLHVASDMDPCGNKPVRWRALGPCDGRASLTLGSSTADILAQAIRTSPDTNPFVRDTEPLANSDRNQCSDARGAIIDVDGQCWEHTHSDQLSVYDFTLWDKLHGGNMEGSGFFPIKAVAYDSDSSTLHFPSWHPENRWRQNANGDWTAIGPAIGRLGDNVSFAELPRNLQSTGLARAVGVGVRPADGVPGVEVCGSPGEVGNDPTLGNRFYFGHERYRTYGLLTQQELLYNFAGAPGAEKQTVHATIAVFGPDQLRQRLAWTLSSTFIVAEFGSAALGDHGEVWTAYYDIFVRNAFGSYRDIMREVSFNPIMGMYLTFKGSASYSKKGSVPDENYAREIMQLFSLGLWILNEDGTKKLSENGQLIPTYNNDDIVEFAKCWTGFDTRPIRGNIEQKRISAISNQIDPMRIVADRRDPFPKMDLHQGHIGDAYPLCTDLGPQPFLRVGAKYRFLGLTGKGDYVPASDRWDFGDTSPINEPLFTPDSSSPLFTALCNANPATGLCRLQSVLSLDVNLPCHGEECSLDTLRIIKLRLPDSAPVYYEYVHTPCISLAFFVGAEGGKYIDNVNHIPSHQNEDELIERICADPRALVAAPACCNSGRHRHCFEYRCSYVEERVSFTTAIQRCNTTELWTAAPPPPPILDADGRFWSLYPEEYQTEVEECPPGSSAANESFCWEAATAAMANGGEPHFNQPRRNNQNQPIRIQNRANYPSGCIVMPDGYVVFNQHASGRANENSKLVCSDVHEDLVTDYRNASKLFCARKRRHCWWDNSAENCDSGYNYAGHESSNIYWWTDLPCRLQAQVNVDGRVSVVHAGSESRRRVGINSENWFRVRWQDGHFPKAASACGAQACSIVVGESGETCLCDVDMTTEAVFVTPDSIPSQADVEESLRIGAPPPEHFDPGTYTICETSACQARAPDVQVYTRGTASAPQFDETTIFKIEVNRTGADTLTSRTLYLANKQSSVYIANATGTFSFRNPPQFMTLVDPSARDALYETEALLDHLFYHINLAPFVAQILIKHMVTSNPSPRYVQAVGDAFKSGAYAGHTYSGRYGDVGAATAAVLLDREARSLVLAEDPTYGQIRAPLLRLIHLMRSLEYRPREFREIDLADTLEQQIGQAVYMSPTVFSFFSPEFTPEGSVQSAGLVAPEAQLAVLPCIIGLLDGLTTLIFDGLSSCTGGIGGTTCRRNFASPARQARLANEGYLNFEPTDFSSVESVVDELDLLLTGGRLDENSYSIISAEYTHAVNLSSCPIDRTQAFCGMLTPGDQLYPGESITNAHGEVLCMTYDGVAQHIGVDGLELFSTAYQTRGGRSPLRYENNGYLAIGGMRMMHQGPQFRPDKWRSDRNDANAARAAFHSFLSGPCILIDAAGLARQNTYGYTSFGGVATEIVCNASDTCNHAAFLEIYSECRDASTADTASYDNMLNDLTLGEENAVVFTVQAANDAHIGFFTGPDSTSEMYEIILGGWSNSKSAIRQHRGGSNQIRENTPSVLSSSEPRQFWASVINGHVRVGTGAVVGSNVFLDWQDPDPHSGTTSNIGLMTGWGATGLWHVCSNMNNTELDVHSTGATISAEYEHRRLQTASRHALHVAESLVAASPAYAVTNNPALNDEDAVQPPARTRRDTGYKALVVLFMQGGADTFNLLVPHSGCDDRNGAEQYTHTRGDVALDLDSVLQIDANSTQLCDTMGIHPNFGALQQLYNDGDAAFTANIGSLVQPVTQQEVVDRTARLPAGLFAHNLQTQGAKTLIPQETTGGTGILGRLIKAFDDQAAATATTPIKGSAYSITTDRTMFRGSPIDPILLSATEGMLTYEGSATGNQAYNIEERSRQLESFTRLASKTAASIFADAQNDAVRKALVDSERISRLLANSSLTQNWEPAIGRASAGHGQRFVAQFQQVANVISSRHAFDAEVDIFFVELGGFDHHAEVTDSLASKYRDINIAIETFSNEMKAMGVWDRVALQSLSEFGRTMTTNGLGTDHAWGGNQFLIGGSVKGGKIHGRYPEPRIDGPQSVSATGQMMPTSPWEAIWKPLALWLGVEESQLNNVMPNLHEFVEDQLFQLNDVFAS